MFKVINGKLVKVGTLARKEGRVLAVLRPMTEEAAKTALAKAQALVGTSYDEAAEPFNAILADQGQMRYMGLLGTGAEILDPQTHAVLGKCAPGDSFIRWEDLGKFQVVEPQPSVA